MKIIFQNHQLQIFLPVFNPELSTWRDIFIRENFDSDLFRRNANSAEIA